MNAKITLRTNGENNSRLSLWLNKLPQYRLPLNTEVAQRVHDELTDPNATAERLSNVIQQEPALCLSLFLCGQRQLQQRQGDIQSMVHLLGLLGLKQIETAVKVANKQHHSSEGQRELFAASLFAAQLAEALLPLKHGARGSHFHLPSLLFNAPLWLMWAGAPKLMQRGQQLISKKQYPLKRVCKQALGFPLSALLKQTHRFLALPDLTLKALAIDPQQQLTLWATIARLDQATLKPWLERNRAAKRLFQARETGIYLINQYTLALYLDRHGKHKKRWSRLLCRHLGLEQAALDQHILRLARSTPMPQHLKGIYAPLYRVRGLHCEQSTAV